MRKHLGMTKPHNAYLKSQAVSNQVSVCSCDVPNSDSSETSLLKKQIAEIQAQVTALKQSPDQKSPKSHSEKAELTAL